MIQIHISEKWLTPKCLQRYVNTSTLGTASLSTNQRVAGSSTLKKCAKIIFPELINVKRDILNYADTKQSAETVLNVCIDMK